MAAPLRQQISPAKKTFYQVLGKYGFAGTSRTTANNSKPAFSRFLSNSSWFKPWGSFKSSTFPTRKIKSRVAGAIFGGATIGAAYIISRSVFSIKSFTVCAGQEGRPKITPSRQVIRDTDNKGLKLTFYQFQTCPFCCKVRAMLDYHGFSYDVVEVNSVTKKQLKWSDYQKVPLLIVEPSECKEEVVLKDSSVIISVLESYLNDSKTSIAKFNSFFPCLEEKEGRKTKYDFPNKYFIMFQEKQDLQTTPKQRNEERKWRKWVDSHLVHMLSPNVYRTGKEALQAFNHFSEVGEWEKNFSYFERLTVIYVGALVMYVLGMFLKRKYELKDDVRQSLYESCDEWVAAVGKKRPFMGGDEPNLADLAVYGVLNSIEGCLAFDDLMNKSKIGPWFARMKVAINEHQGTHPLNSKTTPSNVPKSSKER